MPKALVVDDSRAMRMVLVRSLAALGFDVLQAANGKEALDTLEREGHTVSLVMLDWNMPLVSGFEVVQRVRSQAGLADVRLVMVTTETETSQMERALDAGADEYIMKPFTHEAIVDKLRMIGAVA